MRKLRERPKNSEKAKHEMFKCNENAEKLESKEFIAENGSWVTLDRKFYVRVSTKGTAFWLRIAFVKKQTN